MQRNYGVKFQNDDQKNMTIFMVPKSQWLRKIFLKIGQGSCKDQWGQIIGKVWFVLVLLDIFFVSFI